MTTTTATGSSTGSLVSQLGSGSGIDTGALIDKLIEAQFAAKTKALGAQGDTLTAQVSGIAKVKGGITGFDAALRTLVKGGTLRTQPTSTAASVATATTLPGQRVAALDATVGVVRLATAQAATTREPVAKDRAFQAGTLTISVGTAKDGAIDGKTFPAIAVAATDTLATIAAKVNAAGTGVTANVVSDGTGQRLTFKGATGTAQAFSIAASGSGDGASLATLAVPLTDDGTGARIGSNAGDAELTLDGASFRRATNSVTDLVAGVRLDLKGVGTTTLGTAAPTAALNQAVGDFVETYNAFHATLAEQVDPVKGMLKGDTATTALARALGQLTTVPLAANAAGEPRTLGDIGVRTNRDGTLAVDAQRLSAVLARYPAAVEAMFADGSGASLGGASAALGAIAQAATAKDAGLDAASGRYTRAQATLSDAKDRVASDSATARTRMTQQFAAMDTRVAAYKAQQTFLDNQIKAWNRSDS